MYMKNESITTAYNVVVIGGGAAGIFAAIMAARRGLRVLLLEKNNQLGKKLLITGKGRCNVTNNCSPEEVLRNIPRNGRFLYSAINAFPPADVISYFEENHCPLKTERGNRVFPTSDRSVSILDCLSRQLTQYGVDIRNLTAKQILEKDGKVCGVLTNEGAVSADCVILATGGVSYPATGSTGDGYRMAAQLGHTIILPEGSLVPLEIFGEDCTSMQGLSLRNVGVKLFDAKGRLLYRDFGELLFTHFGISGPTVLSASAHLKGENCIIQIDLKPALDEVKLNERLLRDLNEYKNRTMENALTDLLPRSMIPVVLRRLRIPYDLQANSLKKEQRKALIAMLKSFSLEIKGKRPVEEAIITSGGIKVNEINPKTMESKLVKNLLFAGEVLDCDAYTGGFNLQIAWSTAYAAAMSIENFD